MTRITIFLLTLSITACNNGTIELDPSTTSVEINNFDEVDCDDTGSAYFYDIPEADVYVSSIVVNEEGLLTYEGAVLQHNPTTGEIRANCAGRHGASVKLMWF